MNKTEFQPALKNKVTAQQAIDLIGDICRAVRSDNSIQGLSQFHQSPQCYTSIPFLPIVHRPIAAPIAIPMHSKPLNFGF